MHGHSFPSSHFSSYNKFFQITHPLSVFRLHLKITMMMIIIMTVINWCWKKKSIIIMSIAWLHAMLFTKVTKLCIPCPLGIGSQCPIYNFTIGAHELAGKSCSKTFEICKMHRVFRHQCVRRRALKYITTRNVQMYKLVQVSEVEAFIQRCMEKVGTSKQHSEQLAKVLVAGDARGHFSHGLNRLGKNRRFCLVFSQFATRMRCF